MSPRAQAATLVALVCALVGSVASVLADEPVKAPRAPDAILNQYCNVCHLTGWNGAPLSGDANDWQSRLSTGFESMFKNAKQGINNMPPMGTCQDCTDAEHEGRQYLVVATGGVGTPGRLVAFALAARKN